MLKGAFFFLTHPRFVLVRPHSMHQFSRLFHIHTTPLRLSQTPSPSSFLSTSLPLVLYPSLAHFCFGLSFRLSLSLTLSTSVSASNSNSNSNSFIGMTRESLARALSPCLPLHKATRPGPVTSGLAWSTGCMMLRRGSHPSVLGQICGQPHYGHVSVVFV